MKIINRNKSWRDPSRLIEHIYLEQSCCDSEYAQEIIERAKLPVTTIGDGETDTLVDGVYPENLSAGKKVLLLARNKGQFLKNCPATREYQCCDYSVISSGLGCPIDCTYCILQAYLNNPFQSFFVNIEDLFAEIDAKLQVTCNKIRIGTGEFTDSMALDRVTELSRKLIVHFAEKDNALLELKTKCAYIDNVQNLDHNGRTVMAWSLNSESVVSSEEFRAATIEERLEAASLCASWGYHLAFHFDPIIAHAGWQKGYKETINRLFAAVPGAAIKWISLGAFRYLPKLKQIGTLRFPYSQIYHHEFIEGLDTKQRYFRPLRVEMYRLLYNEIKKYADPNTCVYFCMESDEIWEEVMGFKPSAKGGLPKMLDDTF